MAHGSDASCYNTAADAFNHNFTKGDRVRIRDGYDFAGSVGYYVAMMNNEAGKVIVEFGKEKFENFILAAAIEPYPLTLVERIEQELEDYYLRGDSDLEPSGILE